MARVGPQRHRKKKPHVTILMSSYKHLHSVTQCITAFLCTLLTEYTEIISVYRFNLYLGALVKLRKGPDPFLHHVCSSVCLSVLPSVRPQGKSRLPLDGFSLNFIFENFLKICRENLSLIKFRRE